MTEDYGVLIVSEQIEPFAAMLIGRMFARCEAAKSSPYGNESECAKFWYVVGGLEKIAVGVSTATHFSIGMNNHIRMVADYIEREIGRRPSEKDW